MKFLFDQNLSHRLLELLEEVFPGSAHVKDIEMETSSDTDIWKYVQTNSYTTISKDSDFHQRSFVLESLPKVIWIQRGNCSTREIYKLLDEKQEAIKKFGRSKSSSFLILE